jgi:hypothetical protein
MLSAPPLIAPVQHSVLFLAQSGFLPGLGEQLVIPPQQRLIFLAQNRTLPKSFKPGDKALTRFK